MTGRLGPANGRPDEGLDLAIIEIGEQLHLLENLMVVHVVLPLR